MASWSTRRKYGYLLAIVAFFALVGAGVFFGIFYKAPTCFDGKQNGSEHGVDCGGACQRLCPADYAAPRVLWTYSAQVVPGVYNALAYVQNPNPSVAADNLPYTFKLYDDEGVLIIQKTGTAYVPAGSRFPVFQGGIQTGSRIPARTTFEFTGDPNWQPGQQIDIISRLSVDVTEGATPSAQAQVRNTSTDLRVVNMDAFLILYDENDNRVAFSKTVISSLGAGETKTLYFTWPQAFPKHIVRSELLFVPQR